MNNNQLRQTIRKQRRALSTDQQVSHAKQLRSQLKTMSAVRSAKHIALYIANAGEIDPKPFLHWAWTAKKRCYLPVITSSKTQPLLFAEVRENSQFYKNKFALDEPIIESGALKKAKALDLILMPLVCFDSLGNRIGMGGGFYDRTLAFRKRHPYYRRPMLIGLAHEFQRQSLIKPAAWDVPLDGIATESCAQLF